MKEVGCVESCSSHDMNTAVPRTWEELCWASAFNGHHRHCVGACSIVLFVWNKLFNVLE